MTSCSPEEFHQRHTEYIRSAQWAAKKAEFFASDCYRSKQCYICQTPWQEGFHVHHMTYSRLGEERLNDLAVTCPGCHKLIHETHNQEIAWAKRTCNRQPTIKQTSKKLRKAFLKKRREEYLADKEAKEQERARFASKLLKVSEWLQKSKTTPQTQFSFCPHNPQDKMPQTAAAGPHTQTHVLHAIC